MEKVKSNREEQREKIRERIKNTNLEERKLIVIPAEEVKPLHDEGVEKRVCAYCRVSTDDPAQTTSYELQKQHYEEQINNTPGWVFSGIYADEGISATSLKNRDQFNRMIEDCYAGKIDVIVTKNVSRFARNVVDCLSVVRKLAQLNPPVGVKFETEGFFSLDNTSEMILTVLAAAAQEESKTKSNSMIWSLEQRFAKGNFLTPVLLGYDHDEDGNLVINQDEALTVRLIFYSFLSGYTTSEIADILTSLKRPTKKGNLEWSASSVRQILKNERHCGDVLSWKTYTYDFWEHKKRKNNKNRKQVLEIDHHDPIVSHEVFEAAQAKMQHDRFSRKGQAFPSLNVVDGGILKGYVSVNRMWRGFSKGDYYSASESVYEGCTENGSGQIIPAPQSKFNLEGFEIVRAQFFSTKDKPLMTIADNSVTFNTVCMKKFSDTEYVELLFNAVEKCIAIRPCDQDSPNAIQWGKRKGSRWRASKKSISGFAGALFSLMDWDRNNKYRLCGQYLSDEEDQFLLFDLSEPEIICTVPKGILALETDCHQNISKVEDLPNSASIDPDTPCNDTEDSTMDLSIITDHDPSNSKMRDQIMNAPLYVSNKYDSLPTIDEADRSDGLSVFSIEIRYPDSWEGHFGYSCQKSTEYFFDRIPYMNGWEILRPAKVYRVAGGVIKADKLEDIRRQTKEMLEELGYAI